MRRPVRLRGYGFDDTSAFDSKSLFGSENLNKIMQRIEANAGRFDDAFESALDKSSLNGSALEDQLNRRAGCLDAKEFQEELENTLMISAAMNRLVLRSTMTPDTSAEWTNVRQQLNTLASTFGYPLLPDTVASVRVISSR